MSVSGLQNAFKRAVDQKTKEHPGTIHVDYIGKSYDEHGDPIVYTIDDAADGAPGLIALPGVQTDVIKSLFRPHEGGTAQTSGSSAAPGTPVRKRPEEADVANHDARTPARNIDSYSSDSEEAPKPNDADGEANQPGMLARAARSAFDVAANAAPNTAAAASAVAGALASALGVGRRPVPNAPPAPPPAAPPPAAPPPAAPPPAAPASVPPPPVEEGIARPLPVPPTPSNFPTIVPDDQVKKFGAELTAVIEAARDIRFKDGATELYARQQKVVEYLKKTEFDFKSKNARYAVDESKLNEGFTFLREFCEKNQYTSEFGVLPSNKGEYIAMPYLKVTKRSTDGECKTVFEAANTTLARDLNDIWSREGPLVRGVGVNYLKNSIIGIPFSGPFSEEGDDPHAENHAEYYIILRNSESNPVASMFFHFNTLSVDAEAVERGDYAEYKWYTGKPGEMPSTLFVDGIGSVIPRKHAGSVLLSVSKFIADSLGCYNCALMATQYYSPKEAVVANLTKYYHQEGFIVTKNQQPPKNILDEGLYMETTIFEITRPFNESAQNSTQNYQPSFDDIRREVALLLVPLKVVTESKDKKERDKITVEDLQKFVTQVNELITQITQDPNKKIPTINWTNNNGGPKKKTYDALLAWLQKNP